MVEEREVERTYERERARARRGEREVEGRNKERVEQSVGTYSKEKQRSRGFVLGVVKRFFFSKNYYSGPPSSVVKRFFSGRTTMYGIFSVRTTIY